MSKLRLRSRVKFFASLFDGVVTKVRKDGLAAYVDLNTDSLLILGSYDPSAQQLIAQSTVDKSFGLVTITQVLTASQTTQEKTGIGNVNVATTDGLIIINKTVGAATTVTLPLSSSKVGPVKIVDWKGDSATNNITVALSGSDKLNGGLTTWIIAANGASAVFHPISDGSGYAV